MNWKLLHGIGSDDGPEKCYLTGYNGTGAAVAAGTPVCWDSSAADVRTFVAPATASFKLVAGVAEEAVGTAEYTSKIVAYGPVNTLTYGVATNSFLGLMIREWKTYLRTVRTRNLRVSCRCLWRWLRMRRLRLALPRFSCGRSSLPPVRGAGIFSPPVPAPRFPTWRGRRAFEDVRTV